MRHADGDVAEADVGVTASEHRARIAQDLAGHALVKR
jgi:hypothetical protein